MNKITKTQVQNYLDLKINGDGYVDRILKQTIYRIIIDMLESFDMLEKDNDVVLEWKWSNSYDLNINKETDCYYTEEEIQRNGLWHKIKESERIRKGE